MENASLVGRALHRQGELEIEGAALRNRGPNILVKLEGEAGTNKREGSQC